VTVLIAFFFTACNNNTTKEKTLEIIAVTTLPNKTTYTVGEDFNPEGMVVTAYYDDGSTAEISGYTIIGFDSAIAGNKTITVSFEDKTATLTVNIQKTLESIAVTTLPNKTTYTVGEDFNPAGMIVTAYYDDGSSAAVAYTITGYNSDIAGGKTITVTFEDKTAAFTVNVWQAERFAVTFTQITDAAPQIEGPVIYLIDREGKSSSAIVEIDDPDRYGSIKWHINGNVIEADSVTLQSSDYGLIGEYFITVEVRKDGIPYSKTVTFSVAP